MEEKEKEVNWNKIYIILLALNLLMIVGLLIFQNVYA